MSILNEFPPRYVNLDFLIQEALKSPTILQTKPTYGLGYRISTYITIDIPEITVDPIEDPCCVMAAPQKSANWIIELFSEMFVDRGPKNSKIGYTLDEFMTNTGIFVSTMLPNKRHLGQFLPQKQFEGYLKSGATRVILHRFLDDLKTKMAPNEDDIEKYSTLYMNRNPSGDVRFSGRSLN